MEKGDNNKSVTESESTTVVTKLLDTVHFAAIKHKDQRRKDKEGTPYINHPIGVAHILWKEGGISDISVLQGAVLHDTVEDTDTTLDEIEEHFGPLIRKIVSEVTDDKSLPKEERKRLQIVHAPAVSHEAKLVKLADKLYNLRDLESNPPPSWSQERITEYFHWAKEVVDGLRGSNKALEDKLDSLFSKFGVQLRL